MPLTIDDLKDALRNSELPDDAMDLFRRHEFAEHIAESMSVCPKTYPEAFKLSLTFSMGYQAGLAMGKKQVEIELLELMNK